MTLRDLGSIFSEGHFTQEWRILYSAPLPIGTFVYAYVRLIRGFQKPLVYKIPKTWNLSHLVGALVHVPIQKRTTSAIVTRVTKHVKKTNFEIKELIAREAFPLDATYHDFIERLAHLYHIDPVMLYQRLSTFLVAKKATQENRGTASYEKSQKKMTLTSEQKAITETIAPHIKQPSFFPSLLHGVTGSGKTEVYVRLIETTLANNCSAIMLLPEVSLCVQFEHRLRRGLPPSTPLFSFHSATPQKEKKMLWQQLLDGKKVLILGVHLPVLLPIGNLGLIIVDEEHDANFQEKRHPKINSKEAALLRASRTNIPILLGSATPSVQTLYTAEQKNWPLLSLPKRFVGTFPTVEKVLLTKQKRRSFWISRPLQSALEECLKRGEQALIFINRRGYSFFVQCKECAFIFECPNCSVSLTLHSTQKQRMLECHYCSFKKNLPNICPTCSSKEFMKKGIGTQQAVTLLEKIFPDARIKRADLDSTKQKKQWLQTVQQFESGAIDILVGTQTITKGYHFPNVTLVGILWSDLNLHFPVFNASENTLQQLIQVAGRAGRGHKKSRVIVQALSDHPIFSYVHEKDYLTFYKHELEVRKLTGYPPYNRLVQIELKNLNGVLLEKDAMQLVTMIKKAKASCKATMTILGPTRPAVHKIQKLETRHIYCKVAAFHTFEKIMKGIDLTKFKSSIFIVPTQ